MGETLPQSGTADALGVILMRGGSFHQTQTYF
jgi:hypothetical protein